MPRLGNILLGLATSALCAATALASDFRIETKVFVGKEQQPASQNLTLFQAGYVYDYLGDADRVAVFDQSHGRFILLDPARQMKVEIKTEDVLSFSERLQTWAAKNSNSFVRFAAAPQFSVSFDEDGTLRMASRHMTYRVATLPADSQQTAEQYHEFSDWYARFNTMMQPGSTPPFARMEVNKHLAERGLVPTAVELTIPAQPTSGVPGVALRTEHHVSWRLLQRDLEQIAKTANQLAAFKTVDLAEFEPKSVSKR